MRFGVRSLRTGVVRLSVVAGMVLISSPAFAGFVINPTFTANFNTDFGAKAAAAQASWIAAANIFTSAFTDNITVNITVDATAGTTPFGQSSTSLVTSSWAALQAAVVADAKSNNDFTAIGPGGSIPLADPTGGTGTWKVSRAEAKALGLIPSDGVTDGTTTFGAGNPFTFSGAIAAGTYYFQGVAAHEISEVLGRLGLGGVSNNYSLVDAFSFSGPGTRVLGNGGGSGLQGSFSINNGTNLLKLYNNQAANGLDYRDWAPGTNDSFNQFSGIGVVNPVSAVDLQELDVIGYDLAVPEPSTMMLLGSALVVAGLIRRRGSARG